MHWTNGEHAAALKAERERVQREMSIEIADWQASSEAYRLDAERLQAALDACADYGDKQVAEIERLRAELKNREEQVARLKRERMWQS